MLLAPFQINIYEIIINVLRFTAWSDTASRALWTSTELNNPTRDAQESW